MFCALRDAAGVIPAMIATLPIPGVTFGIYCSPMLLAVGYLVGVGAVVTWIAGAVFANFGLIVGASSLGLWDVAAGQGIVSSLGMGLMMGAGFGVVAKLVYSRARAAGSRSADGRKRARRVERDGEQRRRFRVTAGLAACAVAACALIVCFALGLGPVPAVIVVALAWVTTAMSAQSVGQTGIDPMEIFGLIVLLAVAAVSNVPQVQLFFVAGVVSVACGLAGDVMNDFKAGHILGTDPRAQWLGQAAGAVLGAVVAVSVMYVLVGAYGADAFGPGKEFVAAQASVVATMIAGIPSAPAFAIGLTVGFVLQIAGLPAMMLGLGVYLPFYMSFTAALGMVAKLVYDAVCKARNRRKRDALIASGGGGCAESRADAGAKRRVRPGGGVGFARRRIGRGRHHRALGRLDGNVAHRSSPPSPATSAETSSPVAGSTRAAHRRRSLTFARLIVGDQPTFFALPWQYHMRSATTQPPTMLPSVTGTRFAAKPAKVSASSDTPAALAAAA